jgi:hypothetical protein
MLKKMIAVLGLVASVYSLNANAQFVRCDIDTTVSSLDFFVELGAGQGVATCQDVNGNQFTAPLTVALNVGLGLQIGACQVAAHYTAVGLGFALDDVLSVAAQIEITPAGQGAAVGLDLSPFGINATLTASTVNVYNCAKLASVKGQFVTRSGPLTPIL